MPDKKITELTQIVTIANNDVLPIVDISENITKKIDIEQLKAQSPVQSVNAKVGIVVLTKGDVGLSEVDNTSDANKPISTATQTALDAKQDTLVSGTTIKTINSSSILGSGNISVAPSTGINATAISTGVVSNIEFNYLDGVTSGIQAQLDNKVDENAAIVAATKTKITYDAKGLVTVGADATTADIADSTNKRYVTDANLTVIGNTSGTNTGDNAVNSLYSGLAASKQDALTLTTTGTSGAATLIGATLNIPQYSGGGGGTTWGSITGTLSSQTDLQTALDGKVDENAAITGATKTKITYDAKGLVTAGADATTADIAASTNKNYVTDAQAIVIGNTSGTNSGDNAVNSLYSGLAASKQDTLVSGTNIKTVNSTSLVGSGDVAVQATLVSGTNIKTINSTSILGSGNLVVAAGASGVSGAVQFSDGSALASDAANFFWDDTNNRLGVGINVPTSRLHIKGSTTTSTSSTLNCIDSSSNSILFVRDDGFVGIGSSSPSAALSIINNQNNSLGLTYNLDIRNLHPDGQARINIKEHTAGGNRAYITWGNNENILRIATTGGANPIYFGINDTPKLIIQSSGSVGIDITSPTSKLHVKGSGATSATSSLKIQNSSSVDLLNITDDGAATFISDFTFSSTGVSSSKIQGLKASLDIVGKSGNTGSVNFYGGSAYNVGAGIQVNGASATGGIANTITFTNGAFVERLRLQASGNITIGTATDIASSKLTVDSVTQGFLPPRMTTTQKNAIVTPAAGLMVYDTTLAKLCVFTTVWQTITSI